ncbi:MAG: MFS transporter [Nitrososphaerales archaeon]
MRPIIPLSIVTFLLFFSFSLQRPFVPVFMEERLNASILEVGYMASALGLTGLLLAVPAGFISDRVGRRIPVALGASIWAASLAYISVSSEPYQVMLSYAAAGVGTVLFDASLSAFVGDVSPPDRLGRAYGIYNAAIQAGFAAGPAAGAVLLIQTGYRNTFLATAVLPLVAAVTVLLVARSRRGGDSVEVASDPPSEPANIYRSGVIWTGWISIFCISLLLAGVGVLVPLYVRFNRFSEIFIGVLFTVQALTGAFGRLPFGHRIDSAGRVSSLMVLGLLVMALCTVGFALSSSWMWLLLMMGVFGLGLALAFMSASVNIARGTSVANRGLAMGFASMFRFAGFMVGPWVGSLVVSSQAVLEVGYAYGFVSMAVVSLVSIPLIWLIEGRRRTGS